MQGGRWRNKKITNDVKDDGQVCRNPRAVTAVALFLKKASSLLRRFSVRLRYVESVAPIAHNDLSHEGIY